MDLRPGMVLRYARPDINPEGDLRMELVRPATDHGRRGWLVRYCDLAPHHGNPERFYAAKDLLDFYEIELNR